MQVKDISFNPQQIIRTTAMNKIEIIKQAIERQKGQCFVRNYSVAHEFVWGNHVNESATLSNDIINLLPLSSTEVNGVTEKNGWVSVKDRLPEKGTDPEYPFASDFILLSDGKLTYYGQYEDAPEIGPSFIDVNGNCFKDDGIKITHWQPIPAPPINK